MNPSRRTEDKELICCFTSVIDNFNQQIEIVNDLMYASICNNDFSGYSEAFTKKHRYTLELAGVFKAMKSIFREVIKTVYGPTGKVERVYIGEMGIDMEDTK